MLWRAWFERSRRKVVMCQASQLGVHERHQGIERSFLAATPTYQ
jgi:hypothetical protein